MREYWNIDPSLRFIAGGIHAFVPEEHGTWDYEELAPLPDGRHYRSKVLGLDFRSDPLPESLRDSCPEGGRRLRIRSPETGRDEMDVEELKQSRAAERQRAETERQRADQAEQVAATERENRLDEREARRAAEKRAAGAEAELAQLRAALVTRESG